MPFTFAHPALVIPAKYFPKTWYSATGLIAGSMVPDFEYFFRLKVESIYSHHLAGIFFFDLPVALLLAFLFHVLVRSPLIANLPAFLQKRMWRFRAFNWTQHFTQHIVVVLVSLFAGIVSHLLWDSFTHADGFFVQRISALQNILTLGSFQLHLFQILQHLSTLAGLFFIAVFIWKMPVEEIKTLPVSQRYIAFVLLSAFGFFALRYFSGTSLKEYGSLLVTFIAGGLFGLLLAGIIAGKQQ